MIDQETLQTKEAGCQTVADFAALVEEALQNPEHRNYAEELARKAEGLCVEVKDTLAYAGMLHRLGRNASELHDILEEAEMDCQFTQQFVTLAQAFREYCQDEAKVNALMEKAQEFCMTDEEQIDLGDGFQLLFGDSERATECYERGLAGVQDKQVLLQLAEKLAGPLGNPELAKTIYEKAEQKMSSGNELRQLAQSVLEHLGDTEAAGAVYRRAAENMTASNDLINFAEDSLKLGLDDLADQMYQKVLDGATDYQQVLKILPPLTKLGGRDKLIGQALDKACELAGESAEFLGLAEQILAATGDVQRVQQALRDAEERVTSLGELAAVAEKVAALAKDDTEWQARLAEKLEKRKANQARYNEFQDIEKQADSPLPLIQLSARVMEEIGDVFYARKLLESARSLLNEAPPDINLTCLLAHTVSRCLEDRDWTEQIMRRAAEQATEFDAVRQLAHTACAELAETGAGREWARDWYQDWQQKLREDDNAYAWIRLARAVLQDLGDTQWVIQLVRQTPVDEADALAQAQLGALAREAGESEQAHRHFETALRGGTPIERKIGIARMLRGTGVDDDQLRELYKAAMPDPAPQKLRWVEGILEVFHDPRWARQAYDDLMPTVTDVALLKQFTLSRESRLGRFLIR